MLCTIQYSVQLLFVLYSNEASNNLTWRCLFHFNFFLVFVFKFIFAYKMSVFEFHRYEIQMNLQMNENETLYTHRHRKSCYIYSQPESKVNDLKVYWRWLFRFVSFVLSSVGQFWFFRFSRCLSFNLLFFSHFILHFQFSLVAFWFWIEERKFHYSIICPFFSVCLSRARYEATFWINRELFVDNTELFFEWI